MEYPYESAKRISTQNGVEEIVTKLEEARVTPNTQPPHGVYLLSNLDQTFPYPIEIIFKFENNDTNIDVGEVLKQSLGRVLEDYYPLVGKVVMSGDGSMVVDCGGGVGGVPFVEAFSGEEMGAVVGDIAMIGPDVGRELMYSNCTPYETILEVPPLAIQVTTFECGGTILGVRFNHVLIDGKGFSDFMKSWSQVARNLPLSPPPHLDRSILSSRQPPKLNNIPHHEYSKSIAPLIPLLNPNQEDQVTITRSFSFTPKNLSKLRKSATQTTTNNNDNDNDNDNGPTNFELVSALVWLCWTKAKKMAPEKTTQIITAVDGRDRIHPPMPRNYFGNGIVWSCARSNARQLTTRPFAYAVSVVHEALEAVTDEYIRSAIDYHEMTRKPLEQDNTIWITKWSRLPLYDIDFGWGGPTQFAPGAAVKNLVVSLSEGKDNNNNLVVSVNLPAREMKIFEELMESQLN